MTLNLQNNKIEFFLILITSASIPFSNFSFMKSSPFYFIFIIWLLFIFSGMIRVRKKYPPEIVILFFLTIFKIFTAIWSYDFDKTLTEAILTTFPLFILSVLFFNSIKDINSLMQVMKIFIYSVFFMSLLIINKYISGDFIKGENLSLDVARITVIGSNQNELSLFCIYGIIFSYFLLLSKQLNKYFFILIIIFLPIAITLTGSRTGLLCLFVILFYLIIHNYKRIGYLTVIFLLSISLIIFLKDFLPNTLIERFYNLIGENNYEFFYEGYRGWIWSTGFKAFINSGGWNILFGVGYENYANLIFEFSGLSSSHHSTFIGYFVELGLIAFIFYVFFYFSIGKKLLLINQSYPINFFIFLLPLIIFNLTQGFDQKFFLYFYLMICIKFNELLKVERTEFTN